MSSQQPQGSYTSQQAAQAAAYYAQNPQAYQYYQVGRSVNPFLPNFKGCRRPGVCHSLTE